MGHYSTGAPRTLDLDTLTPKGRRHLNRVAPPYRLTSQIMGCARSIRSRTRAANLGAHRQCHAARLSFLDHVRALAKTIRKSCENFLYSFKASLAAGRSTASHCGASGPRYVAVRALLEGPLVRARSVSKQFPAPQARRELSDCCIPFHRHQNAKMPSRFHSVYAINLHRWICATG